MRRWWNWIILLFILGLTALSFVIVWPSNPDRYLPDFIDWPEGKGIKISLPVIRGGTFGLTTIERRGMSLGLDLRGGTRLVLEPEPGVQVDDLDAALDGARKVIELRVNAFGVAESEVNRLGNNRIAVQLPGINLEDAIDKIGRTALLQFCEPVVDAARNVAIVREGTVSYQPQSCEPVLDAEGNIAVEGGELEFVPWPPPQTEEFYTSDQIVWKPATADLDGEELALDGTYLSSNTAAIPNPSAVEAVLNPWLLVFQWQGDGPAISEQVTERLSDGNYPLAVFLDGEPIRGEDDSIIAPRVTSVITSQGSITGLSREDSFELATLLNTGAFPIPLRIVQQQDVDATLGETAVRNSVIAGQVALLLIMVFMVLYYRLPGLMASLALIVYTSFVLAVFKVGLPGTGPIVLTLSGVAAFILSVGMAIDANILIFERMKEELRVGRNVIVALDDGFNRAWSAIRDSNISTLITCAILYWFGNQFGESAIKGFAITLAIGVTLSMFSAITVTRTFMRLIVSYRPIARRLWLFIPDVPETQRQTTRGAPAIAGGSGEER